MRTRTVIGLCAGFVGIMFSAPTASAQDKALIDHGIKVYAAQKCNVCHSIAGKGKKTGPLDAPDSKLQEIGADEIRQWLVNAPEMTKKSGSKRKPVMKNYSKLPKQDIDALVAYMLSLKTKS
jgi:mono/diheme cytochrome c family protein